MTVYAYSRVPAFNPNTNPASVAKSASGSVYDLGDTGFLTPLNLTLVATNTVTTTLFSDANGMFPDFTLVDRTQCVFKAGTQAFVLTTTTPIPGPQGAASTVPGPAGPATTDASLLAAGTVADARLPGRLQDTALSATYVPKWKATTAYLAGDAVLNPSGDTVTAKVNFTSGTTYDAANWNYSAAYSQLAATDRPTGITLNRAFDPATRAYNINRSTMVKARAGMARGMSGAAPMRMHFLGHSFITSSQDAAAHDVIPTLARRIMAADGAFGTVAEGQVMMNYTPAGSSWGGVGKDSRFTFGAGWAYQGSWGLGYGAETCYSAAAGSGDLTWTPDYPVDSFTIYYYKQAGSGQFTYAVDGGAFVSTGVTYGTGSTFLIQSVTVSAGAAGTHTLKIRPPATGGITYIGAPYATNSTIKPAVEVVNGGASGSVAYGNTVGSWTYAGYQNVGGPLDAIGYFKPDLALIMLGVNDAAGVSVANFKTAMTTLIQKVQTSGGDVIILREPTTTSSFNLYGAALYDLCDTLGCGLIETGIDWPSVIATSKAEPYAYIGTDNGHPGPRGNYDIAKTVVNALRAAI